jgi:hypothetical protein
MLTAGSAATALAGWLLFVPLFVAHKCMLLLLLLLLRLPADGLSGAPGDQ